MFSRKKLLGIFVLLLIAVVTVNVNYAKDNAKSSSINDPFSKKQMAAQPKIKHRFTNDAEMQGFVSLIQRKQVILTKISVLQDYLIQEKSKLDQINGQLLLKFQVDPSKNYNLDPKNKVLVEVAKQAQQTSENLDQ